jgi:hypothetical protein
MHNRIGRKALVLLAAIAALALLAACTPGALQPTESPVVASGGGAPAGAQVALVAELRSVDAQTVQVGDTMLRIDSGTQLEAGLKVNQVVRAQAVSGDDGLTAVEISSSDEVTGTSSFELTGLVESQMVGEWVIGGQAVVVTPATEIEGAPMVGMRVKAEGRIEADGTWVAREIERLDGVTGTPTGTPAPGDEFEFVGVVVSIGASQWVIGDHTVIVTAATELKDTIQVGDTVKVHAQAGSDGVLTAREIELSAGDDGDDDSSDDDSGPGSDDDDDGADDSGPGSDDDDDGDDSSGPGSDDDDGDDNSGPGSDDDDDGDDDNGGHGGDDGDDDQGGDDNGGHGGDDD